MAVLDWSSPVAPVRLALTQSASRRKSGNLPTRFRKSLGEDSGKIWGRRWQMRGITRGGRAFLPEEGEVPCDHAEVVSAGTHVLAAERHEPVERASPDRDPVTLPLGRAGIHAPREL